MVAEVESFEDLDDVLLTCLVVFLAVLEKFELDFSLLMESLLISNDL